MEHVFQYLLILYFLWSFQPLMYIFIPSLNKCVVYWNSLVCCNYFGSKLIVFISVQLYIDRAYLVSNSGCCTISTFYFNLGIPVMLQTNHIFYFQHKLTYEEHHFVKMYSDYLFLSNLLLLVSQKYPSIFNLAH